MEFLQSVLKLMREERDELRLSLDLAEDHRRPDIQSELDSLEDLIARLEPTPPKIEAERGGAHGSTAMAEFLAMPANATAH